MVEQKLPKLTTRVRFPSLAPLNVLNIGTPMFFSSQKFRFFFYWMAVITLFLGLEAVFFRDILFNGKLIGDDGDARFNILIFEHIWQVLRGVKEFTDLGIFYPHANTIGYSDMNVGFAIPYSLCRLLGANMWLSGKIALIAMHFFGTLTLFLFLLKKMHLSTVCALLGTIMFSFSNAYSVKLGHTQLIAISLVPVLLWSITNFFEHIQNEDKRFRFACFSIIWYALICYTAFYTAFFVALFGGLVCLFFVILAPKTICATGRFIQNNFMECLAYVGLMVFVMAPFLSIYLPISQMFGNRPYDIIQLMLPTLFDFVNVSPDNVLYGNLMAHIPITPNRPYSEELRVGFPFLTMALILISCLYFLGNYGRNRHVEFPLKAAWSLAILTSCLLIFKTSDGHSLWYFIWAYMPGADSMRAVSRYLMFLTLPCAILVATALQLLSAHLASSKTQKRVLILLCFLIWAENLHARSNRWDIQSRQDFIAGITPPPSDCSVFYLWDSRGSKAPYQYQLDAWEIATHFQLKTINGYSGQFPRDWNNARLFRIKNDPYLPGVKQYIAHHKIKDVCAYDMGTNTWEMVPETKSQPVQKP